MGLSDTLTVLLICIGLLAGTFFCAYAPSLIKASPKVLNLVAIYGGGVIIGAAIVIILPEAASILINAQHELDELKPEHDHDHEGHEHTMPDGSTHSHEGEIVTHEMSTTIGTAILIGFVFLLIVDEATSAFTEPNAVANSSEAGKDNNEMQPLLNSSTKEDNTTSTRESEQKINSAFLTTIALCIHSLTEGVAMGASLFLMTQGSGSVGIAITIALFLHKAPEAAGYGTFILHNQVPVPKKVMYMLSYAGSSPLTAFIAFVVFNSQGSKASDDIGTDDAKRHTINFWIGYVLLIAVGTLLYITLMHILPEVYSKGHHHHDHFASSQEEEVELDDEKNHGHSEKGKDQKASRGIQLITLLAGLFTAELLTLAPHPH